MRSIKNNRQKRFRSRGISFGLFSLTLLSCALAQGPAYAISILAILLLHEFGHYFAARFWRVRASLPIFLPAPTLFGTFGAVIKMEGAIPNRRALFDIGFAGPAAGVIAALPITIVGIALSEVVAVPETAAHLKLGESVLFKLLITLIPGTIAEGHDLLLPPIALAGSAGL